MVGEKLLMITNYRDELLKFYVKKYNDLNENITLEGLSSFLDQKFPNLDDNQKLVKVYNELRSKLTNEEKDQIFELFCKGDSNIKTEDDFLVLRQNTELVTMNTDEKIKELSKNGQLIKINADIERGFNYPFILYIPNGIDKSQMNNLLLHSCNTPYGMIDYKSVEEFTISCQLDPSSLQFTMANNGKIPLIMPIIPRFIGYNPEYIEDGVQKSNIETFIKMQSKLEPKYQMPNEQIVSEFNRSQDVLLQQMNMCDYAISYLRKQGIKMSDNIKVEGHSAGSKNAASLCNAFPERIVKNNGFFLGATTGRATINDKMVTGVIYNGTLDNNNPAEFYVDEKGLPHAKYEEEYSDKYMFDEQRKYNESLEEWKKENPNKDLKEFDIVKYNIRKQQERESKLGRTSLLVEGGHNVCQNEIIKEAAIKFAKEREITKNKEEHIEKMKMSDIDEKKYSLLYEKRDLKEKAKEQSNINSNKSSNGFINIIYASIVLLVIVIIYLVLVK